MSVAASPTATPRSASPLMGVRTKLPALPLLVGLYLVAVIIPIQVQVGPIKMSLILMLMVVMFIPLTVQLLSGKYGRLVPSDLLFTLHLFWAALALAVNSPSAVVSAMGSNAMEFLGSYVLARATIRSRDDFVAFIRASSFAVVCTLPFALFEALTARDIMLQLFDKLPGVSVPVEAPPHERMGLDRAQVGFAHPILYGVFCSLSFTLTLVGLRNVTRTPMRIVMGLLVFAGCFLSLSSGAILAVIFQVALLAWNRAFRNNKRRWRLLIGLFVLAYITIDLLSNRTPMRVFMSYATFEPQTAFYRNLINEWGMVNVWANPFLGIGFNDWVRPAFMNIATVDNYWLLTAMQYGIPAFLFVAAGYFWGIWSVARRDFSRHPELAQLRFAWVVTMTGLSLSLITVHIWGAAYSYVFFLFGAGMWMVSLKLDDPGEAPLTDAANPVRQVSGGHSRFQTRSPVWRTPPSA